MNRPESVDQLKAVWAILSEDLDAAIAYSNSVDSPYAQRALVRAFFALVEGFSYQLRQVTIASSGGTPLLTTTEIELLRERRLVLADNGNSKETDSFLPFRQGLLFSVRTYVKNHGAEFEPETNDQGWQAMLETINLRHRVTHPKTPTSLTLSGHDLDQLFRASDWWQSTLLAMFRACREADEFWQEQLREADSQ
jgi:hypothetical protein